MIESDDFIVFGNTTNGLQVVHEMSCGGIIHIPGHFVLLSKDGKKESFYVPKGHIKIIDNYPESPIECAIRETREEMEIEPTIPVTYNGFMTYSQECTKFPKTKQLSYKTISYLGLSSPMDTVDRVLSNNNIVRAIHVNQIQHYCKPQLVDMLSQYRAHCRYL